LLTLIKMGKKVRETVPQDNGGRGVYAENKGLKVKKKLCTAVKLQKRGP